MGAKCDNRIASLLLVRRWSEGPDPLEEGEIMKERIAVNPEIHFGKPCVAGTRIPVQNVLELVREGLPFAEIIRDYYPDLALDDIRACVQYAMDVVAAEDIRLATSP
jgi:uncharacterized protein (DUF433 family)